MNSYNIIMSLQQLLNSDISTKPWSNLYTNSINTNTLTANTVTSNTVIANGLISAPAGVTATFGSYNNLIIQKSSVTQLTSLVKSVTLNFIAGAINLFSTTMTT